MRLPFITVERHDFAIVAKNGLYCVAILASSAAISGLISNVAHRSLKVEDKLYIKHEGENSLNYKSLAIKVSSIIVTSVPMIYFTRHVFVALTVRKIFEMAVLNSVKDIVVIASLSLSNIDIDLVKKQLIGCCLAIPTLGILVTCFVTSIGRSFTASIIAFPAGCLGVFMSEVISEVISRQKQRQSQEINEDLS